MSDVQCWKFFKRENAQLRLYNMLFLTFDRKKTEKVQVALDFFIRSIFDDMLYFDTIKLETLSGVLKR